MRLFDTELKQNVGTLIGDVHVEVKIEYRPMVPPSNTHEEVTLDMINSRLRYFSGEISHTVREMVNKAIESNKA